MFVEPRKFRGVNFSVRGIVYPTVVQTERLSPACTVESPGVLVKKHQILGTHFGLIQLTLCGLCPGVSIFNKQIY